MLKKKNQPHSLKSNVSLCLLCWCLVGSNLFRSASVEVCLVPASLSGVRAQPNPALQEEINQYCVNIRGSSAHPSPTLSTGTIYPHSTYSPHSITYKLVKEHHEKMNLMKQLSTTSQTLWVIVSNSKASMSQQQDDSLSGGPCSSSTFHCSHSILTFWVVQPVWLEFRHSVSEDYCQWVFRYIP